jgi:hypothetical protein
MDVQDTPGPHENLFDCLRLERPLGIELGPRQQEVADAEVLDQLRPI